MTCRSANVNLIFSQLKVFFQPVQPTQPTPVPEVTAKRRIYEGSDKPPYSYSQLIRFAIEDTVDKRCTLAEIYSYISHNFIF